MAYWGPESWGPGNTTAASGWNSGETAGVGETQKDPSAEVFTESCKSGGDVDSKRSSGCHVCGEDGHFARDCTQPRPSRTCHKCQEEGHIARDCPSAVSDNACRKCGEDGHFARDCTNASANQGRSRVCRRCDEEGHIARDCPNSPDASSMACFNCGEAGHRKADCPSPPKASPRGPITCYKCQQEGHISRDCTQEDAGPPMTTNPDGSPKVERYIAPKLTVNEEVLSRRIAIGLNFDKYSELEVAVSDTSIKPLETFEAMKLHEVLMRNFRLMKFISPTPIQKYSVPIILAKQDLMASAQTGSGKTFAFIAPMLHDFLTSEVPPLAGVRCQTPLAVVLAPTRELARQITHESQQLCLGSEIYVNMVYGGAMTSVQVRDLREKGTHILVATCGRLKDLLEKNIVSFSKLRYLVFDEADRMLDMGFEPDIRFFVDHSSMPHKDNRQTLMFSATFPKEVQQLARDFLKKQFMRITVGTLGAVNADVEQTFIDVSGGNKREILEKILDNHPSTKRDAVEQDGGGKDSIIIFVETQRTTDYIAGMLANRRYNVVSMHSGRTQEQRESALRDLKDGKYCILVATAVAARGLDIQGVTLIINYDLPKDIDDYVHKVGRTGRVGNVGRAISFFDLEKDRCLAPALVKALTVSQQPIPEFVSQAASSNGASGISAI